MGDLGSVPGLGRTPGEGKGYLLQYFGLENSMDCIVHWVSKSQTDKTERVSLSLHYMGMVLGNPKHLQHACLVACSVMSDSL